MTTGIGQARPAVIMIVDGRVPPGGRGPLEDFHGVAESYFHDHSTTRVRLQWDDDDPLHFRALFEYETEESFEKDDVRTRVDPQLMLLNSRFLAQLDGDPVVSVWRESARQYCADLVRAYWGLLDAREWSGLRAILADGVVFEWPAFDERVVGADAVVAAGRHAPLNWVVRVVSVLASGEKAASQVSLQLEDGQEIMMLTFWEVRHQRLSRATEYWSVIGRDPRPGWRRAWSRPIP